MRRPMGWVVQYRLRWYERARLGCGGVIGLSLAVVSLGAFGFVVTRSLDGTLLSPAERSMTATGAYIVIALLSLWFGGFALRWSFGSLLDLCGAEVVAYGPVEGLKPHQGAKARRCRAVVAGETVELPSAVFGALAKGDRVWMRVGRFQRSLKELARPDRLAPPRLPAHPVGGVPATSPPTVIDATAAAGAGKLQGAIADADLRRSDVPASTARWTEVERFALTFDGARGPELFALHERHALARTLPEALPELRAILFLEQRRHRHAMRAPTGEELARVRAIVEAIRVRVPPDA